MYSKPYIKNTTHLGNFSDKTDYLYYHLDAISSNWLKMSMFDWKALGW